MNLLASIVNFMKAIYFNNNTYQLYKFYLQITKKSETYLSTITNPHYNLEKYLLRGFVLLVLLVLKANLSLLSEVGWIGGLTVFLGLFLL